jgi:hypothetical protein
MSVADFHKELRLAGSEKEMNLLVRWGLQRKLHEAVWEQLLKEIAEAEESAPANRPALVAEAQRIAAAVQSVTGERTFARRARELQRSAPSADSAKISVQSKIAEARKVLKHFGKPEAARPVLAEARKEAEAANLSAELAEIAELEKLLPVTGN